MLQDAFYNNSPSSSYVTAEGLNIRWQQGPVQNGRPNGASPEDVITAAIQRLVFEKKSRNAVEHLLRAVAELSGVED